MRYWYGKFRGPEGKSTVKSTKATDRQKALAIAIEWEKASRKAEAGTLAEAQARRMVSEIYEIAAGQPISFVSIEKFLNDWLAKKRQTNAEAPLFATKERSEVSFNISGLKQSAASRCLYPLI